DPTNTSEPAASCHPFGEKKLVSTPVGIEQTAAPGALAARSARSGSDTATVRLARRQARSSARRTFRHSTPGGRRRQRAGSTWLRRFQMTCSTLWSKKIVGTGPASGTFGVVYRKSATQRSPSPAASIRHAASRTGGTCHFQRSTGSGESHDPATARAKAV